MNVSVYIYSSINILLKYIHTAEAEKKYQINYGLCRQWTKASKQQQEILIYIKSCGMIHKFQLFNYWSLSFYATTAADAFSNWFQMEWQEIRVYWEGKNEEEFYRFSSLNCSSLKKHHLLHDLSLFYKSFSN